MRLNTGGKPKGVRKFFSVECVHPVPEQHEQPVHVFTGSSVAMWPAWFVYARNKEKYLSSPCSTCRSISGFLTGIFGRGGGRNCTHQTGQSNRVPEKSHSTLFCYVALVMCYSWELLSAGKRLAWRPKSLSTTPVVLMEGGQAPALHLSTAVGASQDVALFRLENTNETFRHLHCMRPHFVLWKEKKQKSC